MRTNGSGGGRNVNDILALFDKVGDPFSGGTGATGGTAKPGEAKPADRPNEAANMVSDAALQNAATVFQQPKPGETNAKTGFDREDRATLTQKPPPATETKSSSDQKQSSKDPSREARDQTLGAQAQGFANKLQDGLQKGLAAAFAKLASFGKGAEGAEPDPHVVPHSKDSAKSKDAKDSKGAASSAGAHAAETHAAEAHNFASHTTEGAPSDAKPAKAQEKEEHVEHFREELRSLGSERGEAREAKKLDKPRDGKEPHEIVKSEVLNDSQEVRELVGGWKSEHCALEEEQKQANALRIEDALGEQMRCRGMLEDGTRCIRKPVMGIPYCREHASAVYAGEAGFVSIGAGVEPTQGPIEVTEPEAVAYSDAADAPDSPDSREEVADPTLPETPVYVVTD